MYSKLNKKQNLRKVAKLLYIFIRTPDEIEKYVEIMQSNVPDNCIPCYNVKFLNIFNPELQLINTKPMIELKKFKV